MELIWLTPDSSTILLLSITNSDRKGAISFRRVPMLTMWLLTAV